MNELFESRDEELSNVMTTKELADVLGVDPRTVRRAAGSLDMNVQREGSSHGMLFNEAQATAVKLELQNHSRVNSFTPKTDLEKALIVEQAMQILLDQKNELMAKLETVQKTNNLLMHTPKTYTASEIAKEVGLRSAQVLNKKLHDLSVQYCRNGTWLPTSLYADKGLYEIKQETLPNNIVVYNSHFTQKGREFILNLKEQGKLE